MEVFILHFILTDTSKVFSDFVITICYTIHWCCWHTINTNKVIVVVLYFSCMHTYRDSILRVYCLVSWYINRNLSSTHAIRSLLASVSGPVKSGSVSSPIMVENVLKVCDLSSFSYRICKLKFPNPQLLITVKKSDVFYSLYPHTWFSFVYILSKVNLKWILTYIFTLVPLKKALLRLTHGRLMMNVGPLFCI